MPNTITKPRIFETSAELAAALRKAADAHHKFESELGHPDEDWPKWYATYILSQPEPEISQENWLPM